VAQLRAHADSLAARSHRAVLDLYAADTALAGARNRLAVLERQVSAARAERELLERQTAIATRAKQVSERRLAVHLTALYEQGQPDPLATILGATSLDDAVSNLDALNRVANQDRAVVRAAVTARRRFARLSSQLAARTAELQAAEQQATASLTALEQARATQTSLIASLRSQQRFTRGRIATLQAIARAAQSKTQQLVSAPAPTPVSETPSPDATTDPAAASPTAAPAAGEITVVATGYSLPGHTSTGLPVGWGIAAVDPSVIPLGTHMTIPGYGDAVAADTGGGVRGAMIDLWFPTLAQARAWGRRTVTISLH
jgi:cystine transport system substrate-binding protein